MDFLEAGRIVKPCGLKGRIKALSYLESNDILQDLDEVSIKRGMQVDTFRLKGIRTSGTCFFLDIDGIEDLESATALVGCEVMIPADKLKKLPEDEYYWRDIIGMEVITEEGHFMGRIETILPTGSNDVYVCTGGERELLLPAIAEVVRHIDLEQRRMVVRLLEGL
jgi:16S rRNA processing protein RimM